jgi:ribosomal protein RSM22 (predicted rRNA methylase)
VPWEDEKFIYLAASRRPAHPAGHAQIAPPHAARLPTLKLCQKRRRAAERIFAKRDGASFKVARKLSWGDIVRE